MFAIAAVALLAASAVAAAQPDGARGSDARPIHRDAAPKHDARPHASAIVIELSGTGTSRGNETYDVSILGKGLARGHERGNGLKAFVGIARLEGVVTDADGNIVETTHAKARFMAHQVPADDESSDANNTDNPTWKWALVSKAELRFFSVPKLMLRGTGTGPVDGALDVQGQGFGIVLERDDNGDRLRMKLDVDGVFARPSSDAVPKTDEALEAETDES